MWFFGFSAQFRFFGFFCSALVPFLTINKGGRNFTYYSGPGPEADPSGLTSRVGKLVEFCDLSFNTDSARVFCREAL